MKLLQSIFKNQAGQALPMVLILLVLGGLLVVPMLSFMTTNLNANRVIEGKTEGIYAADTGIQDALWKLGNGVDPFPGSSSSYDLPENVNGMTVTVDKVAVAPSGGGNLYTLKATSRLDGQVKAVITAQAVSGSNFSWLFKHALNSAQDINLQPNNIIYGGVMCGGDFTGNPDDVKDGGIVEGAAVTLPTEEMFTARYLADVDDPSLQYHYPNNGYPNSSYSVSGGTPVAPQEMPALYRDGDLSITGSGYAKLTGTIFVDGKFSMNSNGLTLDLNGQTIYATYYNSCSGNAVDFGSNSHLVGPGCIIGVGNVNFQPGYAQGSYLIGADEADTGTATALGNTFLLSKFQAAKKLSGNLASFQVKCHIADPEAPPAHVKVALYKADGDDGKPGTLVQALYPTDNMTSSWNTFEFSPAVTLQSQAWYWLAAMSDADVISTRAVTSTSKYKAGWNFSAFTFQSNPDLTGFTYLNNKEYELRGFTGGQEFIFLMSVKCTTNLQPGASFYGSIAGNAMVNLQPNCFIDLVGLPDEGLNFPGITGSSQGSGSGGNSPPILNYNIE